MMILGVFISPAIRIYGFVSGQTKNYVLKLLTFLQEATDVNIGPSARNACRNVTGITIS
jgi:hypothetical protein